MKKHLTIVTIGTFLLLGSIAYASSMLNVGLGGTGIGYPFGFTAGTILIGNGVAPVATSTNLTFATSTNTLTVTNASTTNLSASQSIYAGSNRMSGERYPVWSYSTSTAWTGSTTVSLIAPFAGTLADNQCVDDAGTLNVETQVNSTVVSSMFNASTTKGTVTYTGSNTFVRGDTLILTFGTPASSPTTITCTGRATGY